MAYGTPTGVIEECPRCRERLDVDEQGRVPDHNEYASRAWLDPRPNRCPASQTPSLQEGQRREAGGEGRRRAEIEEAAVEAAVALDAFLEGRPDFKAQHSRFLRLALAKYRLRWVNGQVAKRLWKYVPMVGRHGKVICIICGAALLENAEKAAMQPQTGAPGRHLTECMLRYLAGQIEAVPPGHRGTK